MKRATIKRVAPKDRGFVLINALVMVAAMAAVATFLLMRAEQGRSTLAAAQGADQLTLYLDAAETQAMATLARDAGSGAVDTAADAWAQGYSVAVDRGQISGQLRDAQGLFNINTLVDPENTRGRAAFERLLSSIALPPSVAQAIIAYVQPGGPAQNQPYARLTPPRRPAGGPLMTLDQLEGVPGLTPLARVRMQQVATALPDSPPLNINTAPAPVLASLLPGLSMAQVTSLVAARDAAPYTAVAQFVAQVELLLGSTLEDILDAERLSVGSQWFVLEARATLEGASATRRALLFRAAPPLGVTTRWRISVFP